MPTPKFKPGQSGNPAGRPKDKTPATLLRKSIADQMPDILNKLVELAKGGDVQAAKVLLDRVCPPLKPQALPVCLPISENLTGQGEELIRSALSGNLAPDIASQLLVALAHQAKIIEVDELTKRISKLERIK